MSVATPEMSDIPNHLSNQQRQQQLEEQEQPNGIIGGDFTINAAHFYDGGPEQQGAQIGFDWLQPQQQHQQQPPQQQQQPQQLLHPNSNSNNNDNMGEGMTMDENDGDDGDDWEQQLMQHTSELAAKRQENVEVWTGDGTESSSFFADEAAVRNNSGEEAQAQQQFSSMNDPTLVPIEHFLQQQQQQAQQQQQEQETMMHQRSVSEDVFVVSSSNITTAAAAAPAVPSNDTLSSSLPLPAKQQNFGGHIQPKAPPQQPSFMEHHSQSQQPLYQQQPQGQQHRASSRQLSGNNKNNNAHVGFGARSSPAGNAQGGGGASSSSTQLQGFELARKTAHAFGVDLTRLLEFLVEEQQRNRNSSGTGGGSLAHQPVAAATSVKVGPLQQQQQQQQQPQPPPSQQQLSYQQIVIGSGATSVSVGVNNSTTTTTPTAAASATAPPSGGGGPRTSTTGNRTTYTSGSAAPSAMAHAHQQPPGGGAPGGPAMTISGAPNINPLTGNYKGSKINDKLTHEEDFLNYMSQKKHGDNKLLASVLQRRKVKMTTESQSQQMGERTSSMGSSGSPNGGFTVQSSDDFADLATTTASTTTTVSTSTTAAATTGTVTASTTNAVDPATATTTTTSQKISSPTGLNANAKLFVPGGASTSQDNEFPKVPTTESQEEAGGATTVVPLKEEATSEGDKKEDDSSSAATATTAANNEALKFIPRAAEFSPHQQQPTLLLTPTVPFPALQYPPATSSHQPSYHQNEATFEGHGPYLKNCVRFFPFPDEVNNPTPYSQFRPFGKSIKDAPQGTAFIDLFLGQLSFDMKLEGISWMVHMLTGKWVYEVEKHIGMDKRKSTRRYDGCVRAAVVHADALDVISGLHKRVLVEKDEGIWVAQSEEECALLQEYCIYLKEKRKMGYLAPVTRSPLETVTCEFADRQRQWQL